MGCSEGKSRQGTQNISFYNFYWNMNDSIIANSPSESKRCHNTTPQNKHTGSAAAVQQMDMLTLDTLFVYHVDADCTEGTSLCQPILPTGTPNSGFLFSIKKNY